YTPLWITPELWPVWWRPTESCLSMTMIRDPGRRRSTSRATASPTIPAPTTARSYRPEPGTLDGSPAASCCVTGQQDSGAVAAALSQHRRALDWAAPKGFLSLSPD